MPSTDIEPTLTEVDAALAVATSKETRAILRTDTSGGSIQKSEGGPIGLITDMLQLAYDGVAPEFAPPNQVEAVLGPVRDAGAASKFKAGPILRCGIRGPARFYVADVGEPDAWEARVLAQWPSPELSRFVRAAPSRRMVDIDRARARVFLDDLQDVPHALSVSSNTPAGTLMCATMSVPDGRMGGITKLEDGLDALPRRWADRARELSEVGIDGMWAVIWTADRGIEGLLVVNEARWRGRAPIEAANAVARLDPPESWDRIRQRVALAGYVAYPDSVEVHAHGWDVTVGVCPAVGG